MYVYRCHAIIWVTGVMVFCRALLHATRRFVTNNTRNVFALFGVFARVCARGCMERRVGGVRRMPVMD